MNTQAQREQRAQRYSQRPSPPIRATNRGVRSRMASAAPTLFLPMETTQETHVPPQEDQRGTIPEGTPEQLFIAPGAAEAIGNGMGNVQHGEGETGEPVEAQIRHHMDADRANMSPYLGVQTSDDNVQGSPLHNEEKYFIIIHLQAGMYRRRWDGNVLVPRGEAPSVTDLLGAIARQWTANPSAREALAEAYDAITDAYSTASWTSFQEDDVDDMFHHGLLHEPSREPCQIIEPSLELAELCDNRHQDAGITCIGLYLLTATRRAALASQAVSPDIVDYTFIKELDLDSYKWLCYWKNQAESGEYGSAYQRYRIILIAVKLMDRLGFPSTSPETIRRTFFNGSRTTITLPRLWIFIQEISDVQLSFRSFQNAVSEVRVGVAALQELNSQPALTRPEEERRLVLEHMLRKKRIPPRSQFSSTSLIARQVNQMSARDFKGYLRNQK